MSNTILGKDIASNKTVTIDEKARSRGVYIIGKTGFGKSIEVENMAVQDIEARLGVCVIEPSSDLINAILCRIPDTRIQDVILLDPIELARQDQYFGLNLFACSDPTDPVAVEYTVTQIVQIFEKVFGMSKETPRLNQFVRQVGYTFAPTDYTMCEIPNLLLDKSFRDRVVANVTSTSTKFFWKNHDQLRSQDQSERSESTLDRIDSLISNAIIRNIVGQSQTTINFRKIMDSGKILLVYLPKQFGSMSTLLGSVVIVSNQNPGLQNRRETPIVKRNETLLDHKRSILSCKYKYRSPSS